MTAFLRLWEPLRLWHRQRQAQRTRRATQELMAALAQTKPAGQVYVLNRLRRIAPETLFCGPRMDGNGTLLTQQPHFVMHGYASGRYGDDVFVGETLREVRTVAKHCGIAASEQQLRELEAYVVEEVTFPHHKYTDRYPLYRLDGKLLELTARAGGYREPRLPYHNRTVTPAHEPPQAGDWLVVEDTMNWVLAPERLGDYFGRVT